MLVSCYVDDQSICSKHPQKVPQEKTPASLGETGVQRLLQLMYCSYVARGDVLDNHGTKIQDFKISQLYKDVCISHISTSIDVLENVCVSFKYKRPYLCLMIN